MHNTITDPSAASYVARMIKELGVQAHDPERVAVWAYDNPPHKPLPKLTGERVRDIRISRKVFACLVALRGSNGNDRFTVDSLADALLALSVKDSAPGVWAFYEQHEQNEAELFATLRKNEPALAQEEAS